MTTKAEIIAELTERACTFSPKWSKAKLEQLLEFAKGQPEPQGHPRGHPPVAPPPMVRIAVPDGYKTLGVDVDGLGRLEVEIYDDAEGCFVLVPEQFADQAGAVAAQALQEAAGATPGPEAPQGTDPPDGPEAHQEASETAGSEVEHYRPPTTMLPLPPEWAHMQRIAADLAASALVPSAMQGRPANVALALLYGRDLGLSATAALTKINVIEGKPALSAEGMAMLIRRAGHHLDGGTDRNDAGQPVRAWVRGRRKDTGETMEVDYTVNDAAAAGLCTLDADLPNGVKARAQRDANKRLPWEAHTSDMLWARAVSRLGRRLFADVLAGITYTPDELNPDYVWSDQAAADDGTPPADTYEPMTVDQRTELNAAMKALNDDQRKAVGAELNRLKDPGELPGREFLGAEHQPRVLEVIAEVMAGNGDQPPCETDPDDGVVDAEVVDDTKPSRTVDQVLSDSAYDNGADPDAEETAPPPSTTAQQVAAMEAGARAAADPTMCPDCGKPMQIENDACPTHPF